MPLQLKPRDASPRPAFSFSPPASPLSAPEHPPRPPADFLPEKDMHMFGSEPLRGTAEPGRGLLKCSRCGRVTMEWAVGEHQRICSHVLDGTPLNNKKGVKAEKGLKTESKKRRASEESSASPTKKRFKLPESVADESDVRPMSYKGMKKSEIKRLEKERLRIEKKEAKEREKMEIAERKRLRATCPVDYDRQCGVINDKGLPCSRSLTCKTHNVGAKRAVEGRSRPYDELYLEWQRANNPNFKEPPTKKDREARKAEKRDKDKTTGTATAAPKKKKPMMLNMWDDGAIDLDGEEGQRELEDLIDLARMSGERLGSRSGIGRPGAWSGISGIGMGMDLGGGGGSGGQRHGATWKGCPTFEFAQVGDLLTKALAARPRPIQHPNPAMMAQRGAGVPPPKNAHMGQMQHSGLALPMAMATGGQGGGPHKQTHPQLQPMLAT